MSNEELRRLLVDAVPDVPVRPREMIELAGGMVTRRRMWRISGTVAAAMVLAVSVPVWSSLRSDAGPHLAPPAAPESADASPSPALSNPAMPGPPSGSPNAPASASPTSARRPGTPPGVRFDPAKIPAGSAGSGHLRVRQTGHRPPASNDGQGWFRTACLYSHMAPDDPLLHPGRPGTSYLNMFWGNTGARATSTAQDIAGAGNSTCKGGIADRSAYWTPALIDTATGAPLAPRAISVYYQNGYGGVRPEQVVPIPAGLRMVAGNPAATGRQEHADWGCENADVRSATIPSCAVGDAVVLNLAFPQCWDGAATGTPDFMRHMAYVTPGKGCPAGWKAIPELHFHVYYPVSPGSDPKRWRLASDGSATQGGYTIAGGFSNGWRPDLATVWTNSCVGKPASCSSTLGDGRMIDGDL